MSMMRARVRGHRWVDHHAAAVMKARVPGQWVDRPAAVVMEVREQGRCWIDHPAVAVMEARVQGRHWVDRISVGRLHTFQSCAGTAVKGCSLTATPPAGANRVPRLDALSTITNKICTAMQNQTLPDCPEFMNCTKLVILPMEPAWKMMNPKAWCHVSVQIAECARSFSRTCMVPSGLKAAINGIYDDLLQEGCYNVFKYVKSPATQAPEKTTDPTSGGSMLMAVSWITMLAMAYLRQL
ncbi:hypothetical protein ACOMHN_034768 [Nucella lapillus]